MKKSALLLFITTFFAISLHAENANDSTKITGKKCIEDIENSLSANVFQPMANFITKTSNNISICYKEQTALAEEKVKETPKETKPFEDKTIAEIGKDVGNGLKECFDIWENIWHCTFD